VHILFADTTSNFSPSSNLRSYVLSFNYCCDFDSTRVVYIHNKFDIFLFSGNRIRYRKLIFCAHHVNFVFTGKSGDNLCRLSMVVSALSVSSDKHSNES